MTISRAVVTWLLLLVGAIANGALRQAVYAASMSELAAHQISCFTGTTLFAILIWAATRRWPFRSRRQALLVGGFWLAMTVAWELLFGHCVFGWPWQRLLHDYEFWTGRLWVVVLASLVLLPVIIEAMDNAPSR
jgi:hypothetical protein